MTIPKIWTKPNPKLFPIPNIFDTESDTFFDTNFFWYWYRYFFRYKILRNRYQYFFSKPKFFETDTFLIPKILETNTKFFETDTFFDTKNVRNRYRYFFRYQIFPKPIPILFSIPKFSETDTIKKNQKVSKPRSFQTEMSNSASNRRILYAISFCFNPSLYQQCN